MSQQKSIDQYAKDHANKHVGQWTGSAKRAVAFGYVEGAKKQKELCEEREKKLKGTINDVLNYLHWREDDLIGDDLIGDQRLTKRYKEIVNQIETQLKELEQ